MTDEICRAGEQMSEWTEGRVARFPAAAQAELSRQTKRADDAEAKHQTEKELHQNALGELVASRERAEAQTKRADDWLEQCKKERLRAEAAEAEMTLRVQSREKAVADLGAELAAAEAKLAEVQEALAAATHGDWPAFLERKGAELAAAEAQVARLRELLAEVLAVLQKEAPGTPLNHHKHDSLGIRIHAALDAREKR